MHSESQWRYRAYRMGLRLVKYKTTSPAFQQYGPYALVDRRSNRVRVAGLDAEAVDRELFADKESRIATADSGDTAGVATAPEARSAPE